MNIWATDYISEKDILNIFSQEQIFELVFSFKPIIGLKVTSPIREDNNPDCFFRYYNGILYFIDFGSQLFIGNKVKIAFNCFELVQYAFNLNSRFQTLLFIKNKLNNTQLEIFFPAKSSSKDTKPTSIFIEPRPFDVRDKNFWKKYQITSNNLIEDKVQAVAKFTITNHKGVNTNIEQGLCYAYTDFEDNRLKLYRPFKKKFRFISTCTKDDVGGIKTINYQKNYILITKSYKDYRVLKNQNTNVIWFQNEGMFPNKEILFTILKPFNQIFIFFDNDRQGNIASLRLKEYINSFLNIPINTLQLTNSKDPADFIHKYGKKQLVSFLNTHNVS